MSDADQKDKSNESHLFTTQKRKRASNALKPRKPMKPKKKQKFEEKESEQAEMLIEEVKVISPVIDKVETTNLNKSPVWKKESTNSNLLSAIHREFEEIIPLREILKNESKRLRPSENFLLNFVEKLRSEDFPEILSTLFELCSELSLSSDSLAEDPNCSQLMKELLKIFDKFNSPELSSKLNKLLIILKFSPSFSFNKLFA
jgi:hypothetical protein